MTSGSQSVTLCVCVRVCLFNFSSGRFSIFNCNQVLYFAAEQTRTQTSRQTGGQSDELGQRASGQVSGTQTGRPNAAPNAERRDGRPLREALESGARTER